LLNKGANINAADGGPYYSRTALQAAAGASRGDLEVVQMLLDAGANVNAPAAHRFGITALQGAASRGYIAIVFMLLKARADINAPGASYEGRTALEAAAEHGRLDVVQLLLNSNDSGISSEIRGYENSIVLAKKNGHLTVAKLLEDSGLTI
jgi:ankyrin repeat protein